MFKKLSNILNKEYKEKIDKVYDAVFHKSMFLFGILGDLDTGERNLIVVTREEVSKLQQEVIELKKLLFTYFDLEKQTIKSEYVDEDGDDYSKEEVKLVKKIKSDKKNK